MSRSPVHGAIRLVPSVARAFADLVAAELGVIGSRGASLFLSGGPTAEEAYRQLADTTSATVDWSAVDVWWGDERCVPIDDPDSNHRLCCEALLDRVGPVRSDHPMYRSGKPEDAADAYQSELAALESFDIVHLGMGPDGHTASLFPGADTLDISDPNRLVVATKDPKANNAHDRISLTLPAISRARLVIFTVSGESKREAFAKVIAGEDLPAARVVADQVLWLVDAAAVGDTRLP